MPKIISSVELRSNYDDVSLFCHKYSEPVFITRNGKCDLAVMSIETYESLQGKLELYKETAKGLSDVEQGRTRPLSEGMADIRKRRKHSKK